MKFTASQKLISYVRQLMFKIKNKNISFGENTYIGKNACISAIYSLSFHDDIYIGKNVTIEVEGEIGSKTLIGNNVGIVGRKDHDISNRDIYIFDAPTVRDDRKLSLYTTIGKGVWVGFGSIILSGVTIGDNAVIAAGSVVKDNVAANAIVSGNPAKVIKQR